jgi:hypothetical protein
MMGFFNEDFYKELDKEIDTEEKQFVEEFDFDDDDDEDEDDIVMDSTTFADNMNLQVNKSNQEKFKTIMDNASTKYDTYWDINSPIIRIVLIALGIVIAVGLIYYIVGGLLVL